MHNCLTLYLATSWQPQAPSLDPVPQGLEASSLTVWQPQLIVPQAQIHSFPKFHQLVLWPLLPFPLTPRDARKPRWGGLNPILRPHRPFVLFGAQRNNYQGLEKPVWGAEEGSAWNLRKFWGRC